MPREMREGVLAVSLTNVWVATQGDGMVRADQITGIDAHPTPKLSGKPGRWLLDIVVAAPIGSGTRDGWTITATHRTLIQTGEDPGEAPAALARPLAQLDHISAAGMITANRADTPTGHPAHAAAANLGSSPDADTEYTSAAGRVRFRFEPFTTPATGPPHRRRVPVSSPLPRPSPGWAPPPHPQ